MSFVAMSDSVEESQGPEPGDQAWAWDVNGDDVKMETPGDDLCMMVNPLLNVEVEFKEKTDERVLFFCDECGKSFKSKKGYNNHSHDKNRERVKCGECGADFAGPSSLYLHVRNIHGQIKYPCDQCDYKSSSKQGLERHVQSLHLKAKFNCEQCDAVLSSRGYLLKHIKAVHDKRTYACDLCPDKVYTFYCSLKKHKDSVHHGVYHMCHICGHKSNTKSHLKTHMKVHRNIITNVLPTSAAEGTISIKEEMQTIPSLGEVDIIHKEKNQRISSIGQEDITIKEENPFI